MTTADSQAGSAGAPARLSDGRLDPVVLLKQARGRVLVVDDEPRNHAISRALLEPLGHTVVGVGSGEEALDRIEAIAPDVLLLDVLMDGMNGVEVCRLLKQNPRTVAIPVIIVTGLTDHAIRLSGIEAGADDFLSRPYDAEELRLRVRNAVFRKRLMDELDRKYRELKVLSDLRDSLTRLIMTDTDALQTLVGKWSPGIGASRDGEPEGTRPA